MTTGHGAGQTLDRRHRHYAALTAPDNFTIFKGTSEIQHMISQIRQAASMPGYRSAGLDRGLATAEPLTPC